MSLLLLFSGTEVNISEEPKMISAVEPAIANDEIVQGTPFLTSAHPHTCTPTLTYASQFFVQMFFSFACEQ
jgi:hypothetical protein